MKKPFSVFLLCVAVLVLSACGAGTQDSSASSVSESASAGNETSTSVEQPGKADSSESLSAAETPSATDGASESAVRQISVQFGENVVIYELNNGSAADSLYEQLPLTIAVEDYSTNEKIFYPPEKLDTSDSPLAKAGAGTLAYYASWGDVVMFYGDYNENPSLYELGQIVSGAELVSGMSGTISITVTD